jgi:ectoine hydroxylase-related dioxygenase (phytanoyl-CoA dioxygenase family)
VSSGRLRATESGTSIGTTEALRELGVTEQTLSDEERAQLDRDGFLVLGRLLPGHEAAAMHRRLDAIRASEGKDAGRDFFQEPGSVYLGDLINKEPVFDICCLHPRVLAAAAHILGYDFGLSSLSARTPVEGGGEQELHRDSSELSVNALWMVTGFTEQNGATRVVPGSHRFDGGTPEEMGFDPHARHPAEMRLIAPAGTAILLNAWTWHAGGRNNTTAPRYLVSAIFTRRGRYQARGRRRLLPATQARFDVASLHVLDHELA